MRVLLLGGTDFTLAVAGRLAALGLGPAGVVHLGETVRISYAPQGFANTRHADLAGWCRDRGVPDAVFSDSAAIATFAAKTGAELLLAAGWYHMVPAELRARFARGALGLHASLLPSLRGGAPLPWAILTGMSETGMSLFALGDGIDDGPIYGQRRVAIAPRSTVGELVAAVEQAALDLISECLPAVAAGTLEPRQQSGSPSYGLQRNAEDGRIDWRGPADAIDRLVRAVGRPYPGAFGDLQGERIMIWKSEPRALPKVHGAPGQIARIPDDADPVAVTGSGLLAIREATTANGDDALPRLRRAANQRFTLHA
jgi:methionyl-tRNA formyltransferase